MPVPPVGVCVGVAEPLPWLAEGLGVGLAEPVLAEGLPEPGDGLPELGDAEAVLGDGLPEDGLGEAVAGDGVLVGGGDSEVVCVDVCSVGIGGGGEVWGAREKIRMAISTATAASSSISSQEARIVSQPPRSRRPGQGNGQTLDKPGAKRSVQCRR